MNKRLLAGTLTAVLLPVTAVANDNGEFTIRGAYGEMDTAVEDRNEDSHADSGDAQGEANIELKFETDQYFIRATHNRREDNSFGLEGASIPTVRSGGNFQSRQTEAEFGYKVYSNNWMTLS
ncbi:MAG: hypothetical protein HRU20_26005, partial [Pseudomonadales bacterium]|nr:hypothetical protein [Pseudomonadales bacterium]